MLTFLSLVALNGKLLSYDFSTDSGLEATAKATGHNTGIFSGGLVMGVGTLIYSFLSLLGVVFLCLIVYGGMMWMTAEGNEERVEKGRKILTGSTIGLVVVLAAYAISIFVVKALAKQTLG